MAGIAITFTPVGTLFGFVPPGLPYFLLIGMLVIGYIVVVEIVKTRFYHGSTGPDGMHESGVKT